MSSYDERGQFQGLMTAVAETLAPPGALRRADNVVIRRIGAVEPRQGWKDAGPTWDDSSQEWIWTIPFSIYQIFMNALGSFYYINSNDPIDIVYINTPIPTRVRQDTFSFSSLRGNLYLPFDRGVMKLDVASGSFRIAGADAKGMAIVLFGNLSTNAVVLPNGYKVGYRIVGVIVDSNGLETRSRPSGSYTYVNTTGAVTNPFPSMIIRNIPGNTQYTYLEVYRTRGFPSAIALDDEYSLVKTIYLSAGQIGVSFLDDVPDSQRGARLYTSPSQGGMETANNNPPACALLETYRGCMFFANVKSAQRFVVSFLFNRTPISTPSATGIGIRQVTGNITSGSNTITGMSSVVGIQIGHVPQVGTGFPIDSATWVIAVGVSSVTLNKPALATFSGTIYFCDAIEIDGDWYPLRIEYSPVVPLTGLLENPGADLSLAVNTAFGFPTSNYIGVYHIYPPAPSYTHTAVIETRMQGGNAFTLRATHGNEYNPPLPLAGATAETSDIDIYPNGVQWSLQDRPEHVPIANYQLIAEKTKAIVGMVSTRDSLFLFKEEGIWRMYGTYGNFIFDTFDLTTWCILPSSIKRLEGRIFMLSNRGVVAIDESGVEIVSLPIRDQVDRIIANIIANRNATGVYSISGITGPAASVDPVYGEYILLTGDVELDFGGNALVFNARTGAWTTITFVPENSSYFGGITPNGFGESISGDPIVCYTAGANSPERDTELLGGIQVTKCRDGVQSISTVSATLVSNGTQARIVTGGLVTMRNGDIFRDTVGTEFLVATKDTSSSFIVDLVQDGVLPIVGVGTVFRPVTCEIQPHGFTQPKPVGKLWQRITWVLSSYVGAVETEVGFTSSGPLEPEANQEIEELPAFIAPNGYAAHFEGLLLQSLFPHAHARSWMVRASLRFTLAHGRVSLETIGVESRENVPNRSLQASGSTT